MNTQELRRLAESDAPVLAFGFSRLEEKDWAPQHSHARGQLFALTQGLLIVEAAGGRWMFPSQRCAWIPPGCLHKARSVGRAAGSMLYFSAELSQGLPSEPRVLGSSELLFEILSRILDWAARTHLAIRSVVYWRSCKMRFGVRKNRSCACHFRGRQRWPKWPALFYKMLRTVVP